MRAGELERYLAEHIPLSGAMGVKVLEAGDETVLLGAPLAPNINHRETAFGGSVSALAILASWSLIHLRLQEEGRSCRIVIQRNCVTYSAPISGDFTARSRLVSAEDWDRFVRVLVRRGRARVRVDSVIECAGFESGRFEGDFVAIDTHRLT